jgi:hypothetical protein
VTARESGGLGIDRCDRCNVTRAYIRLHPNTHTITMASSAYNLFVRKPVYANSPLDCVMMLRTVTAGIDDVQAELREVVGNKMAIFQIQYVRVIGDF